MKIYIHQATDIDSEIKQLIDSNVKRIVAKVNDEDFSQTLWGEDFRSECESKMYDLLEDEGYDPWNDESISSYVSEVFEGYGEE